MLRLSRLRIWIGRWWLICATTLIVIIGVAVWSLSSNSTTAVAFATYVSGIASALALLWLAAGFRIQTSELALQRQELQFQRVAAEHQAHELSNASKLSSLTQVKAIIDDAESAIRSSKLAIENPTGLQPLLMTKMSTWETIEKSIAPKNVVDAYQDWLAAETLANNHIRYISAAMKMYFEYHLPETTFDTKLSPENFVLSYEGLVQGVPFLSTHILTTKLLAEHLTMIGPGMERMRLAWLVASAKMIGKDKFKNQALEELRDKVLDRGHTLPTICSPWPE